MTNKEVFDRIVNLIEVTEDVCFNDAPRELNNQEASAWASGFQSLREKIEDILKR